MNSPEVHKLIEAAQKVCEWFDNSNLFHGYWDDAAKVSADLKSAIEAVKKESGE